MRPFALLAALGLLGCSAAPAPAPAPPSAARAPVVVTLVVDQLGAWIVAERTSFLPDNGGFARLRREGTWARDVRYPYAGTDTAPGHATLYTGAPPSDSGIFANEIIDPKKHDDVSIVRDPTTRRVGPAGPIEGAGASLAPLRVETLADSLRKARPDAYIVGISIKDRGAMFGAGHQPDAALWFDPDADAFVTSTAFARALPAWAATAGGPEAMRKLRELPWVPLDDGFVRAHATTPDAQPGEGDLSGFGDAFPHDFARSGAPAKVFRASPMADEAIFALALAALDAKPQGRGPTLLALSLSAHDYINHLFGPESWEAWDELYRLDAALGRFFTQLDKRFGPEGWAALLTADHGSSPMPETAAIPGARAWCKPGAVDPFERPCVGGRRVDPDALAKELVAEAHTAVGSGDWVLGVSDPYVYLTDAARALEPARRDELRSALAARIGAHPEVERVIDVRTLPRTCPPPGVDGLEALVCRSYAGAGDLYVVLRPGSMFDNSYVPGFGTNHGSPHLPDRQVALLVRAPGRVPPGHTLDNPLSPAAFTRTAAALLGVPAPAAAWPSPDLTSSPEATFEP